VASPGGRAVTTTRTGDRVGAFRYFRDGGRWEWSDAVAAMHGYAPGRVQPSTALVIAHKHPEDRSGVARLVEAMTAQGRPFSSRHRIVDADGAVRSVLVVGDRLCADDLSVIGCQGFYVDLTDAGPEPSVDAAIADFTLHRAVIEQAKGILMAVYAISAERAFDILVWRSQETNVKLRTLARQIIDDFTGEIEMPAPVRERADHLLLTAHRRLNSRFRRAFVD
jgi:hypothetical protein